MSTIHFREKIRNITKSVENHAHIPEQSKQVGMTIFFIFMALGIISLLIFAVFLFIYGKILVACLTIIGAAVSAFFIYKIATAEPLPSHSVDDSHLHKDAE